MPKAGPGAAFAQHGPASSISVDLTGPVFIRIRTEQNNEVYERRPFLAYVHHKQTKLQTNVSNF